MRTGLAVSLVTMLAFVSPTHATHELTQSRAENTAADSHITWHQLQHDLGSYPGVNATMETNGAITLAGHTACVYEKMQLDVLASPVAGASEIRNRISTD